MMMTMKQQQALLSFFLYIIIIAVSDDAVTAYGGVQSNRVFVSTPVSNFPKKCVADCMSPPYPYLTPDMSVDDTMALLLNNGLSGAPVVNEQEQVIGIVTSFDFLQKGAFEGALLAMEGTASNIEHYVDTAKKICGQKVEDVMTSSPIITVSPNTPMRDAAALMTEKRLHRLPVVDHDNNGRLVGVLTSSDVMRDLQHIVRNLPEGKSD